MKTPDEIKRDLITCTELNMSQDVQHRAMLDALALIRQLEAQVPRWISIRDALPGLHEKVLFTPMCNEGAIYIGELNAVGEYGAAYFAVRCGKRKTCYSVTHWMPLPEPPEENENERES